MTPRSVRFVDGARGRGGERVQRLEKDETAAVDCRDLLYGVGWAVWAGRHYRESRIWEGPVAAGSGAAGVESADESDGGGTGFGAARRGWVLLLGEAGAGWVLGVSRSVAEHGCERVRYGDLSGDLCDVSGKA